MNLEAFILAGGRSTRLGRDKTLERVGGKTLAERAFMAVRDSGIASKIYFVTGSRLESAMEARRLNAGFVFDLIERRGPLGGLHTALATAVSEWIFLLACDLPFVSAELVKRLSNFRSSEFGAVVPEQPDGRLQPLCAYYNARAARPVIEEIIYRPRVPPPMHELAGLLNPRIVRPTEYAATETIAKTYFANVNTEDELRSARELHDADQSDPISGA